jgi:hypothetical protein
MVEEIVAETVASVIENAKDDFPHDHGGIFETETIKCSKCVTTKCIYQLITMILILGIGVFAIIYLKR